MHSTVLQLDIQGTPQAWIGLEQAALHYAAGCVIWEDGAGPLATLRGGWNVAAGRQSQIEVAPIVAVRGQARLNLLEITPSVTKSKLLRRDRHTWRIAATGSVRPCRSSTSCADSRGGAYSPRWVQSDLPFGGSPVFSSAAGEEVQCPDAPAAPRPVSERTCCASNEPRSLAA
jgi:hypothetical protein